MTAATPPSWSRDYSDAYSHRRVWTGPENPVPQYQVKRTPSNFKRNGAPPVTPDHNSPSLRSGSTGQLTGVHSNRVFRKPTGGSFNVTFDNVHNPPITTPLPPPAPAKIPLPHSTVRGNWKQSTNKAVRAGIRLRNSSFTCDDEEFLVTHTPVAPIASIISSNSQSSAMTSSIGDMTSHPVSKLHLLGTSTETLVNHPKSDDPMKVLVQRKSHVSAAQLLFSRPAIAANVLTGDLVGGKHKITELTTCLEPPELNIALFEDIAFALAAAHLIILLPAIPTYAIPRFLTVLVPFLMTHHTSYLDTDVWTQSYSLPTRIFFAPFRMICVFGASWTAVSSFNTDTASSTAFAVFLTAPRLVSFIQILAAVLFEKDSVIRLSVGGYLLKRAAVMVWFPGVFFFLPLFVVQRWIGWRDTMWSCGAFSEVLMVCIVGHLEVREYSAGSCGASKSLNILTNENWNLRVRLRVMRLFTLVMIASCYHAIFPSRPFIGRADASVSMQFAIGPFLLSTFAFILMYGVHWMYILSQRVCPFVADIVSRNLFMGDIAEEPIYSESKLNRNDEIVLRISSGAPPLSTFWRLSHTFKLAGIILASSGIQCILQDLLDQWLGVSGLPLAVPSSLLIPEINNSSAWLDFYLNRTVEAVDIYSTSKYNSLMSEMWDFSQGRVWLAVGISTVLICFNLSSTIHSFSLIKFHNIENSLLKAGNNHQKQHVDHAFESSEDAYSVKLPDAPVRTLHRHHSQRVTNSIRQTSANWGGSINKTQSLMNVASFNRSPKQAFPVIKTPNPSLITMHNPTSSGVVTSNRITALENDAQFWRELLESSPLPSPYNSIGNCKSSEIVLNFSSLYDVDPPPGFRFQSSKHVSLNVHDDSVKHERVWTGASIPASVTEDGATLSLCYSPPLKKRHVESPNIFEATTVKTNEATIEQRGQDLSVNNVKQIVIIKFLLRLIIPFLVLGLIPAGHYGAHILTPIIGNLGNSIDVSTVASDSQNSSSYVDGARWKLSQNNEGVFVLCGTTVILFLGCLIEEVVHAIQASKRHSLMDLYGYLK